MNFKLALFLPLFCLVPCLLQGQSSINEFEKYFRQQDSLIISAYKNKNPQLADTAIRNLASRYNSEDSSIQNKFKKYLANEYYNVCCAYSLADEKDKAIETLARAIENGYFNYSHIQVDKDLDNIRKEEEFLKIIQPLRNIGDFLYILRKADKYNNDSELSLPAFRYQSSDNPDLVETRNLFNLDSIAGGGNDVSRVLNVMHWLHSYIPHDGNHGNPSVKNAKEMIPFCLKNNRGLNCRGLAIALNECYLSLGFKSRFVTCLPKDSLKIDSDCHVINMVYINSLEKWIWIDPTNDAYVMDENGTLLSIAEVRERLITGKPLIVNPDANWNRKASVTKQDYLYNYMAKNLYMFECTVSSEFDAETAREGKNLQNIRLTPTDYFDQSPRIDETMKGGGTITTFNTNNSSLFWAKP